MNRFENSDTKRDAIAFLFCSDSHSPFSLPVQFFKTSSFKRRPNHLFWVRNGFFWYVLLVDKSNAALMEEVYKVAPPFTLISILKIAHLSAKKGVTVSQKRPQCLKTGKFWDMFLILVISQTIGFTTCKMVGETLDPVVKNEVSINGVQWGLSRVTVLIWWQSIGQKKQHKITEERRPIVTNRILLVNGQEIMTFKHCHNWQLGLNVER